ncbi:EthD domain-containing protein [Mycobacterium sp. SMC-4]|uniref:EthD domain-containing protein n=1 Tax=Mycobacterium sp. SMC-4 TaxID=2857059 RepID=UPI003D079A4B
MVTLMMFIRKRSDLSREEFIEYYETRHIRLIGRLVGGRPVAYRRHYGVGPGESEALVRRLAAARGDTVLTDSLIDLAAVTELTFEHRHEVEAMVERMLADDVLPQVLADEQRFIAPGGISWMVAEPPRRPTDTEEIHDVPR